MKTLYSLTFICLVTLSLFSCSKDAVQQPSNNYTLLDKTPDQIRTAVAGNWQVQRESQFTFWDGGSGVDYKTWFTGTGHIVQFLANDTVNMFSYDRRNYYTGGKADIQLITNPIPDNTTPSVNAYFVANGNRWIMKEIKNDTLVFYDVYPEHIIVTYYATRKN